MLQGVSHKFRSGCMMLVRDQQEQVSFLGTAFLVHRDGYLLTAAHLATNPHGLRVVPTSVSDEFAPMRFDRVAAIPVSVTRVDAAHDVALLRIEEPVTIDVPDDFLGATENVRSGASVMVLGYSFGHEQLHAILTASAVVSAKIRSPNDTRLILFDNMVHDGDRGGPLVHVADGHIVDIVSGRFEPIEVVRGSQEWDRVPPRDTNIAFAVAIEYGLDLMRDEGLLGAA
jgi:S1-C subfamily serine protease